VDYQDDIQATIVAVGAEYKRMAAWFRTFPDADWKKPTFCPEWSAAEVVGHLAFGAEFYASVVRNGRAGDLGVPFGAKDREAYKRLRDGKPKEIAALSPGALVDHFESRTAEVHALFVSLDPGDWEKPAWHRRGSFPIRRFIFTRLIELVLHEWDIRNDPGAPIEAASLTVAAGNLQQHFPMSYEMHPVEGLAGIFSFALTDEGRAWAMRVGEGEAEDLGPGDHAADVSFSATASDMMLWMSGRAPAEESEKAGRFRIEGDAAKARAIMPKLSLAL
jgi:uncharacterized protein (TIGR03083 family)